MPANGVLRHIERYFDTVPRATARVEEVGPFTLFVAERGWPYYARPRLAYDGPVQAEDVYAVRARQRELGVPENLEWVDEAAPGLLAAAEAAGLQVHHCPLLMLEELSAPLPACDVEVRLLGPSDPELALVRAAIDVGFQHGGTDVGAASIAERDVSAASQDPGAGAAQRELMDAGLLQVAGAFAAEGAVGGGSHSPRGDVTEITGVAVLPSARRRGIGAAITAALARDARDRGVATVICSAQSAEVARVYERIGFRRVGTACIAEPAKSFAGEQASSVS